MPEKQDEHSKLYGYVVLLLLGLIVFVDGLSTIPSGWIAALLGAGISAFGGFEVRFTYNKIQQEDNSIRAKQTGKKSGQVNQTNPTSSPAIGRARDVYIMGGEATQAKSRTEEGPKDESVEKPAKEEFEWLCNGQIHIDRYQEFETSVKKGDKIAGHLESRDKISLQILSRKDYDTLADILDGEVDEDEEYGAYYSTPITTNYDFSWVSTVSRPVVVVITGGTIEYEKEGFSAQVTAKIKVFRKSIS